MAEAAPPAVQPEPGLPAAPADTVAPEVQESTAPAAPEPSLQERWASPFAVYSRGRTAPRAERPLVVLRDSAAPPRSSPAPAPAAAPAAATATAAAAPAATGRTGSATSPVPAASAGAGTRTHRVEWGETWYAIARQYEVAPRDLAAANPDVDPERLRSGQVLRIPRAARGGAGARSHTVGPGDTLWGIARRYAVSPDALRAANKLTDDRVRLGQTLVIPREERRR